MLGPIGSGWLNRPPAVRRPGWHRSPRRRPGPLPTTDQIKTILAAIGVIAVLYHALRLLGRAVG